MDPAPDATQTSAMARLDLTLDELGSAAQACRVAAAQAEQDAGKQSSPTVRQSFETIAKRYTDLGETFEEVRRAASREFGDTQGIHTGAERNPDSALSTAWPGRPTRSTR